MNRIDRLIAILTTLQSKKYVTAEFVAEKYEISLRTVYRDLKALGEIGVPIYFENQKGYSILKSFFLPPISLTTEEANSLILVSTLSEKFGDKTTKNNIESAISKIKAVLRSTDKDNIDLLHSQIKIYKAPDEPEKPDYLNEIQNSIINKEVLHIEYINNNEETSRREIEPIGLTFYSNQWHLIAWCWMRNSYRDFKVARIVDLKNLKEKFRKSKHYDINEYIKSLS
ncbi:MAG: YafY family transcriptional regulator [Ignavibacteriales bacterium]|nr:MAG: YafY family transcriptional regulator [Ignavibacteriales bacterium]